MYLKTPGSIKKVIQDLYTVWLPPIPSRELILNADKKKKDQIWRRQPLPSFYEERRQEEFHIQEQEKKLVDEGAIPRITHFDPVLEAYRRDQWNKRIYGIYAYIGGKLVYLTPDHWMFLQWSKMDHAENDGYAMFFEPQVERFQFRQLCAEDPFCHGYMFVGPRGGGKTAEEVACQLNNMTKPGHNRHAAIQSKDSDEAKEVIFQQKMVPMFNAYPEFFKPEFSHGTDPKDQMIFKRRTQTGKNAKRVKHGEDYELSNTIRPYAPHNRALDSTTMSDIFVDEIGKLKPEANQDAYTRHSSNLKSIFRFQVKRGLIRCTTTIEEMDKGGDECFELWQESDPRRRDQNNFTMSRMYRFFISALDTQTDLADEFGFIDKEAAYTKIMNEREPIKDDSYKLSLNMRKNPLTEDEAFIKDPGTSPYDMMILTKRISELKMMLPGQRPGKLVNPEWKNGIIDGEVELVPHPEGSVRIFFDPDVWWTKERKLINACNYYEDDNGVKQWMPCNNDLFRGSADPIKFVKTSDLRASKMGSHGIMMYIPDLDNGKKLNSNGLPGNDWISNNFLWEYHGRHTDPELDYEVTIKMMRYFGHSIMPEFNTGEFVKHLYSRGYKKFIIVRKQFNADVLISKHSKNAFAGEQAVHSNTESIEAYVRRTAAFIRRHGHRVNSLALLEQWRDFDPKHPTKYDLAVSGSYAVMALEANLDDDYYQWNTQKTEDLVSKYFRRYDISGNQSRLLPSTSDDGDYNDFDSEDFCNQFFNS
jgi:hypothetical protein